MRRGRRVPRVDTRSELLSLLTEACELEHGLACTYLFAAFSLKDGPGEGLDWDDQQRARKWAAQLYFVASQEMLHLAQAWNLLAAIGGTPYYGRPNFPREMNYYPLGLPLQLQPFSAETLTRFIDFEAPEQKAKELRLKEAKELRGRTQGGPPIDNEHFTYHTVGELYSLIESGFANVPEDVLFVGTREAQIGPELVHFPDIVRVVDRESAHLAIAAIKLQGEGAVLDRQDCHFGIFKKVRDELLDPKVSTVAFARACESNPVTHARPDQTTEPAGSGRQSVTLITHPVSVELADFFDDLYVLMLRMLAYAFEPSSASSTWLQAACRIAIEIMVTCLKPAGEALAMLPLAEAGAEPRAGAPFAMTRVVSLPSAPSTAQALVVERLHELATTAERIQRDVADQFPDVLPKLTRMASTLERFARDAHILSSR
jgi:hypothetical protein